jgi:hypothetical protein
MTTRALTATIMTRAAGRGVRSGAKRHQRWPPFDGTAGRAGGRWAWRWFKRQPLSLDPPGEFGRLIFCGG